MNASVQIPVVSADAGDPIALSNPNSPASLAKKAKEQESQSAADGRYDETPPPRQGFIDMSVCAEQDRREGGAGLFLSLAALLLLYAAAPSLE